MARKILAFDVDDHLDFDLIGIISAFKDYRICYEINLELSIVLEKSDELEIKLERKGSTGLFSLYNYFNDDEEQYYIVANKGNHTWLIPEQKHIDYFMMIRNRSTHTNLDEILENLKKIELINSVILLEARTLKSADHFLYIS